MSIYSSIFQAHSDGNTLLRLELEREAKQIAEQGSLALAVHQDNENPNTARGHAKKDRKRAELDHWNQQIEERLLRIDARLNDPDNPVSIAEGQRLEQERLDLLRYQQELIDTQSHIDQTKQRMQRGVYKDPDELKRAKEDLDQRMERLEAELPVSFDQSQSNKE